MNKHLSNDAQVNGYNFDVDWDKDKHGNDDTEIDKLYKSHANPFTDRYDTTYTTDEDNVPKMTITEDLVGIGERDSEYFVNYQVVKDLFIMECMLESYGEPIYTWIDQNDPNQDGTAKAQWYTNLFNRMQEGGYTTLDPKYQNSSDWLQFAFESSLVHMEQVNKSYEWVSTLYSNCSNITESMVDTDITLAEAKYKREMAKIEAKDKQYDIELKNIDTEHESLKKEYESIKTVIEENIKRHMRMFNLQG